MLDDEGNPIDMEALLEKEKEEMRKKWEAEREEEMKKMREQVCVRLLELGNTRAILDLCVCMGLIPWVCALPSPSSVDGGE
jgi:hypothetical protein